MKIFRFLLTSIFFITPQSLRHRIKDIAPEEFVHFVRRYLSSKHQRRDILKNKARVFEEKLWGGFSYYALKDLKEFKDNGNEKSRVRVYAAWALARWYSCHLDHQQALENVRLMRELCTWKDFDLSQALLEADCLIRVERHQEATELLETALTLRPKNPQLLLSLSNSYILKEDEIRLNIIGSLYQDNGFLSVEKINVEEPLTIENLRNICKTSFVSQQDNNLESRPFVTVIMPVFKAAETLHIAIDSLLGQTWENLEIIVVDDCSPDDTFTVAQCYAERDPRVNAYRLESNQGAYTARNYALSLASGEFVTTHDADDWSHSQKIETQVRHLLSHPDCCDANVTHWVRVFPNLEFRGTSRPTDHLIQWNHSSLMLRRELLISLGGWDAVRITGDTELIWRLEHLRGRKIVRLHRNIPLSFALEDPSSLTRQGNSHVWSIHYGVRREYREMATYWHKKAGPDELSLKNLDLNIGIRSFPAPGFIQADRKNFQEFDILIVMDCTDRGDEYAHNIDILQRMINQYESIGLFHWPHYLNDVSEPIYDEIRDLAMQGKITIVVSGEVVETKNIVACNPLALQYKIDRPPKVIPEKFQVIVTDSSLETMEVNDGLSLGQVEKNIMLLFNSDVEWLLPKLENSRYSSIFSDCHKISEYRKEEDEI